MYLYRTFQRGMALVGKRAAVGCLALCLYLVGESKQGLGLGLGLGLGVFSCLLQLLCWR